MGVVCQPCYNQETQNEQMKEKTLQIQAGSDMYNLKFVLSTASLTKFHSQCLVIYADHCSELSTSPAIIHLTNRIRRKLLEYLVLAQEHTKQKLQTHFITPISISNLSYKYLLFVKMQPWDGKSVEKLQTKLYYLTKSYLQVFQLRKIKAFTIIEPDICLGIHYSVFSQALMKSLRQYSKQLKKITILFNSPESITYFSQNIKKSISQIDNPQSSTIINKKKTKNSIKNDKNKLLKEEDLFIY